MIPLAELEEEARKLGRVISAGLPEGVGFALLLFDFGEGGNLTWMSNARREDMLRALQEFMQKVGH